MTWDYYNIKKEDKSSLSDAEKKKLKKAEKHFLKEFERMEKFILENPINSSEIFNKNLIDRMKKIAKKNWNGE